MKIMASGPITIWQIDGETLETVTNFIFLGSKITADGDWSHEIKRCLLLGRIALKNLDGSLKIRYITLWTKVHIVKAMVFPVVVYRCESWIIKKTEYQIIDFFNYWCWRRHLKVPCTVRRLNQTILNEINPEYSLEGLMLKLKLQHFGHLMRTADSLENTLMLGKIEVKREEGDTGWDGWMAPLIQWTRTWANSGRWWGTGKPSMPRSMGSQKVAHQLVTEQQQQRENISLWKVATTWEWSDCE